MRRIAVVLLLTVALLVYAGVIGSSAASVMMNHTCRSEQAVTTRYRPDLDPGSPFGFGPEVLWAKQHARSSAAQNHDADAFSCGNGCVNRSIHN